MRVLGVPISAMAETADSFSHMVLPADALERGKVLMSLSGKIIPRSDPADIRSAHPPLCGERALPDARASRPSPL